MGFYVQDTWRIHPRVTINAGVRFENEFLPPYKKEQGGVQVANPVAFDWSEKIAPRLGAAWDVNGDGRWKISGSFGYFYDVMKYELARGSFGGDFWVTHAYTLDRPDVFSLGRTTPGALGREIIAYDNRTIPINARGELEGIDPDIKPYQSREFTVSLDHQLASRVVAGVRYTHKGLLRAIEDIGVLDAEDNEVYLIGNPGFGLTRDTTSVYGQKTPNGQEFLVPVAKRQYDAVEFRLQGQSRSFNYVASYTWSRLFGNYSGLANSDESGRSDPGVSRAYDLPYYYFDRTGSQTPSEGRLGTDRPHSFKLFGSYDLKSKAGSTILGWNQLALSGTCDTTTVIYLSAPTIPYGRCDMGRTPMFTQSDVFVAHSFRITETKSIKLEANVINLFNQASVINRTSQLNRAGAISEAQLPIAQFFRGYDPRQFVFAGSSVPLMPFYGLPSGAYRRSDYALADPQLPTAFAVGNPGYNQAYQGFRNLRLGIRFIF
jgi:hypothetical protein